MLTSPAAGATFASGQSIALAATLSTAAPAGTNLEFIANGLKVAEDATAPYAAGWTPASAGSYTLHARLVAAAGGTSSSGSTTITVNAPPPASGSGLSQSSIGNPAIAGSATFDAATNTHRIVAAGAELGGARDEFHFVHRTVTGDVTLTVRVARLDLVSDWSRAGLMVRASLDPSAAHASTLMTAAFGPILQARATAGGPTLYSHRLYGDAPQWLRLSRVGNTFTGFRSFDGVDWTTITSVELALPATVVVGLATSSNNAGAATTAVFENLVVE